MPLQVLDEPLELPQLHARLSPVDWQLFVATICHLHVSAKVR